jgi:hypothetical protein
MLEAAKLVGIAIISLLVIAAVVIVSAKTHMTRKKSEQGISTIRTPAISRPRRWIQESGV